MYSWANIKTYKVTQGKKKILPSHISISHPFCAYQASHYPLLRYMSYWFSSTLYAN